MKNKLLVKNLKTELLKIIRLNNTSKIMDIQGIHKLTMINSQIIIIFLYLANRIHSQTYLKQLKMRIMTSK
jgi:hypothetical protein